MRLGSLVSICKRCFGKKESQKRFVWTLEPSFSSHKGRLGRIPRAIYLEWTEVLAPESKIFKPATELRALLKSKAITPEIKINTDCQIASRAPLATLALMILGHQNAKTYAGSFGQWSRQSDTELER
jgi:3-mercaptopyruvate sulfurtransferase SseA